MVWIIILINFLLLILGLGSLRNIILHKVPCISSNYFDCAIIVVFIVSSFILFNTSKERLIRCQMEVNVSVSGDWVQKQWDENRILGMSYLFFSGDVATISSSQNTSGHPLIFTLDSLVPPTYSKDKDNVSLIIHYMSEVKAGNWPLGASVDCLHIYDVCNLLLPYIRHIDLVDGLIKSGTVDINFFINGKKTSEQRLHILNMTIPSSDDQKGPEIKLHMERPDIFYVSNER